MRKALVVGVDYYAHITCLHGCVNDAHAMKSVLEKHSDGSVNFGVLLLTASDAKTVVTRPQLKGRIQQLFADDSDIALLYFAGHGHIEATGGYLCGSDCRRGDEGLSLGEVLTLANESQARNKVIVLDSCHSGVAGNPSGQQMAELSEGMTILTASTKDQYASEENGSGVFTTLFVDAMNGPAANLVGDVTPGSVYAHIDQSLGPWKQRPVFKTNVKSFVSLRRVQAPIALAELQQLTAFFPEPGFEVRLDPSFELEVRGRPEGAPPPDPENTAKFAVLQHYNRVNLVKPVGAPHMWHAAIESKSCTLTVLGEHYRRLAEQKLI
ncbi:MAG TPA: caspase family protein [Thermoanaerobaculia bacterium]|nr:caspase family protein [Thermoanaerobaculia bacterium]